MLATRGPGFYSATNYIQEVDVFRVNLSYQLSRLTGKLKLTESEFGEKEFRDYVLRTTIKRFRKF